MRKYSALIFGLAAVALAALPKANAGPGSTSSQFLYIHDNGNPNQVWGFQVHENGLTDKLPNSPFATGNQDFDRAGTCGTAAYSARLKMLFTTGSIGVSVFRVASDGQLTLVNGAPFGGTPRLGVAVVDKGKNTYLYTSEPDAALIHIDKVNPDGTLDSTPSDAVVGPVAGITANKNVINFAGTDGKLICCKILKNGELQAIRGIPSLGTDAIQNTSLDPSGKYLYIPDLQANRLLGFKSNVKKGVIPLKNFPLTPPITAPHGLDSLPQSTKPGILLVVARPSGINTGSVRPTGTIIQDVMAYRRNKNGQLTPLGNATSSGLDRLKGGAIDSTGRIVVLVDDVADLVYSYTLDPNTGALTLADTANPELGNDSVNAVLLVKPCGISPRPSGTPLLEREGTHYQCRPAGRESMLSAPPACAGITAIRSGYSTVTLFARFRGWSISQPASRAMK